MIWTVASVALASESGFDGRHDLFRQFLAGAVQAGRVDYGLLSRRRPLLDAYLEDVATAPVAAMSASEALATWVNAYNACTLRLVLDHQPLASIRDLDGGKPWSVPRCEVGGVRHTLDHIENAEIRPRADGRVHAVVNCASLGCAPLPSTPLVASGMDAQLDAAARTWAAGSAVERTGQNLALSEIFRWYADDFRKWAGSVPGAPAEVAGALGFLVAFGDEATAGAARAATAATWAPYDWSLNAR